MSWSIRILAGNAMFLMLCNLSAWRSPCLLNTLYLVALSVAGTMHVFAEPILLRYAGEEPMQIRTSGFRRVQLEWLMVFEVCSLCSHLLPKIKFSQV